MKHSLQLKLSQHLTLTPQLQQSIRLLQLSTLELNQEIERFLQDNPLLEREDDTEEQGPPTDPGPPTTTDFTSSTTTSTSNSEREEETRPETPEIDADWRDDGSSGYGAHDDSEESEFPQLAADSPSLREHLLWQINLLQCPDRDKKIVALLVDTLDDDGYMTQELDELAAMLPAEMELEASELAIALLHLQHLGPSVLGDHDREHRRGRA